MASAKRPPDEQMAAGVVSGPVPASAAIIPARAVKNVTRNASKPSGASGIYA